MCCVITPTRWTLYFRDTLCGARLSCNIADAKDLTSSVIIDCVDKDDMAERIVRPTPLSNVDHNLTSILSSETVQKATRNR